ncbi:MAG: type II toxin-antitoxin system RelB/DinJ family antitoxin [Firmicutes bacterium]|nr:type II toxin-antitoxin system RelB/DinJ family antitoxin [Bacillota bacterium]
MADVTNLNIKIDRDLKIKADKLFNEMGMNLTTAINVFVRQAVLERAIPFKIYRGAENIGTTVSIEQKRAAMQEIRDLMAGVDGNSIDLDQMKAERRAAKFERND